MRNYFIFDGQSSIQHGIMINGGSAFDGASPDVSTVKVPGRNGELIYSNRRFNNFTISYDCFISRGFFNEYDNFKAFLYKDISYRRLEDSYHPNHFRLARITGTMNPSEIIWQNNQGMFKVSFDTKPQKFLKLGEIELSYTASGTILNPTLYDALPLLRVYGYGALVINGQTITISPYTGDYIDIDCDIMEAYRGSTNLNAYVSTGDEFPKLSPGSNTLTLPNTITELKIAPRWWTL